MKKINYLFIIFSLILISGFVFASGISDTREKSLIDPPIPPELEWQYNGGFDLDYINPISGGITSDGYFFYVSDFGKDEIFKFYPNGTQVQNISYICNGGGSPWGLTYNGTNFFVICRQDVQVFDDDFSYLYTIDTGFSSYEFVTDITTNGTDFWIVNSICGGLWYNCPGMRKIHHYDSDWNYLGSISTTSFGSSYPRGITVDDTGLWVMDLSDYYIYHIDFNGNDLEDGFEITETYNPHGLFSDAEIYGGHAWSMWTVDSTDDFAYHYIYA